MKRLFTFIVACVATLSAFAQTSSMQFIGNSDFYVQGQKEETLTNTVKDVTKIENMSVVNLTADIVIPEMHYPMPGSSTVKTLASFTIKGAKFSFDYSTFTATFAEQEYSTTTTDADGATKDVAGTVSGSYSSTTGALTLNCTVKYGSMWTVMNMIVVYESTGYYTVDNDWGLAGRGTAANPYRIFEAADFTAMATNISETNTGSKEYFKVMNDIDFGGTEASPVQLPAIGKAGITSITTIPWGFQGTFDGNNKTISGIYHTNNISDTNGKFNALFSSLGEGGVVKNLIFSATNYINSYNYVAPFVCISKGGSIENCTNNAPIIAANFAAAGICGNIAGGKGTVKNCTNNGDIKAMTYASGICGGSQSGAKTVGANDADYVNVIIDNCVNKGNCSTTNGVGSAGIAGSYSGVVTNCTNYGTIDDTQGTASSKQYTGGIVSCMTYVGGVSGNVNNGEVKGVNYVGGVIGCIFKGGDELFDVSDNTNNGTVTATGTPYGDILGGSKRTQQDPNPTINETSATATAFLAGIEYKITVKRTLIADQWNSLCLPFSMTADEITTAKLGTVMKMTGIESNVVNFADATEIEAGEMYIVKPEAEVSTFTVENKTCSTPVAKAFGTDWTVNSPMYQTTISQETGNTKYVLSNDKFYTVDQQNLEIKGLRWYIKDTTGAQARTLTISLDGETTGINNANVNANANRCGKFVENGRVVIVKNNQKFNVNGQEVK